MNLIKDDFRVFSDKTILVAGGGGFIGGALVKELLNFNPRAIKVVDRKPLENWYFVDKDLNNLVSDLTILDNCQLVTKGVDFVFNLAADMGGMGFIENNKALCMLSSLINTHLLLASKDNSVKRYFFASSACVYNSSMQNDVESQALKEENAYPALPEDGYGWEKLFSERMCRHFTEDFGLETRIARFHNVYGPNGTFRGGREKAPAALCRKIIESKLSQNNSIEIWGDGDQTRSFMFIDDCITGILKIMTSDIDYPINLGSAELVSINHLVTIIEEIADVKVERFYDLDAPKGVRGRNSDNKRIKKELGWEPSITLREGLEKTYTWINSEIQKGN
jgi:nucleoside-diphosphate-sugar epimerase